MFSYRHAFHAGSFSDVLKHTITVYLAQYMVQKTSPIMYIDTHAGAGVYELDKGYAAKSEEYKTGIQKIWHNNNLPPLLADYIQVIRSFNTGTSLRYYPGSPFLINHFLRAEDKLRLCEWHPTDYKILQHNVTNYLAQQKKEGIQYSEKRIMLWQEDGFHQLKALLPPSVSRALILIDPSYEDKSDYERVYEALQSALTRFAVGVYAVWYPLLNRIHARDLPKRLQKLPIKNWLHVTLSISGPIPDGFGLSGSGMFIINPPFTLAALLKETMPYLVKALGCDAGAQFTLETND